MSGGVGWWLLHVEGADVERLHGCIELDEAGSRPRLRVSYVEVGQPARRMHRTRYIEVANVRSWHRDPDNQTPGTEPAVARPPAMATPARAGDVDPGPALRDVVGAIADRLGVELRGVEYGLPYDGIGTEGQQWTATLAAAALVEANTSGEQTWALIINDRIGQLLATAPDDTEALRDALVGAIAALLAWSGVVENRLRLESTERPT